MYNAKTTFVGYRLGLRSGDFYVGVPEKEWKNGRVEVKHGKDIKEFVTLDIEAKREFDHRHKAGTYKLFYVKWNGKDQDLEEQTR